MKIIVKGDINRLDKTIRFTCSHCGCIFEATVNEYEHEYSQRENEGWYSIKCPTCNSWITRNDKDVKFENEVSAYTVEEFTKRMKNLDEDWHGDIEEMHMEMDALLCYQLKALGYEEAIEIFDKAYKWYS